MKVSPMVAYENEPLDYKIGLENFKKLIEEAEKSKWKWTEQDTRFQLINDFLIYCLGWKKDEIVTEKNHEGTFSDYELGNNPKSCVVEAKKESLIFNIPPSGRKKHICSLKAIISSCSIAKSAIEQVFQYCTNRGIEIAVVMNGYQLIAFIASRRDGIPPLDGDAFVIRNKEHMLEDFNHVWEYLSSYGVKERLIYDYLTSTEKSFLPQKISTLTSKYSEFRYKNENHKDLEILSQLLIHDIITSKEVEQDYYNSCYCQSDALSQDACISKKILESRYAGLFPPSELNITVNKLVKDRKQVISQEIMAESVSKRPIVVIGDVGVGKTSFLRGLPYLQAKEEFKKSIYLYIDLGTSGTLTDDLWLFILKQVEEQLLNDYEVDIYNNNFIKSVFYKEIERFKSGLYGKYYETNRDLYDTKLIEELEKLTSDKAEYLKRAINHLAKGQKKQIIITIDNADQRDIKTQDAAFLIAQELAAQWISLVFIALRPETFYSSSRRGGALSGYSPRVFTISPPQLDVVIQKRLSFALQVAKGEIKAAKLSTTSLNLGNIVVFMEAIKYAIVNNKEIREMLASITGGNVRLAIDFIAKFMSNANVNSDKIIQKFGLSGSYLIPMHEFTKAAVLGDYSYFHEETSLAMNLFDITSPDEKEHFLCSMIVSFLNSQHTRKDKDSFVTYTAIMSEMQSFGFVPKQIDNALMRLTNKQLIESIGRVKFERKNGILQGNMPSGFRITSIGVYHIMKWLSEFSYLDAVSIDTPILNENVKNDISSLKDSFDIIDRYKRAMAFRHYLTSSWDEVKIHSTYFDWKESIKTGSNSFEKVEKFITQKTEE